MTQLDIIVPVNEPTDWISSIVVVEKPNIKLRVCLDPQNLNKASKRKHNQQQLTYSRKWQEHSTSSWTPQMPSDKLGWMKKTPSSLSSILSVAISDTMHSILDSQCQ